MDGNGARILSRLLEERHGSVPPTAPRKQLRGAGAAPIFHWFGVEPEQAQDAPEARVLPRVERQA